MAIKYKPDYAKTYLAKGISLISLGQHEQLKRCSFSY
ncbi:hypothetical protein [Candidatus Orientia mediorientalis]|nr:hypothetical protein [Candidatus Orientia mediorientalis]